MSDAPLRVPLFDLDFGERERQAALAPIDDGWLTMGARTAAFERAFAEALGARHAVAVNSGTAALHLALAALGIGAGDEVICPALTFVATANAIRYTGATPVLCDIVGPSNLNLDPADVEARIGPQTRAVLAVHYAGYPADLPRLEALCQARGLHLVEDAAHACIATLRGRACGAWGAAGCFSFFANKNITCGEGGAVVTQDEALASRLRSMRSHGMTTDTLHRHRGRAWSYDVVELGYNYRLDEIRGSILSAQLSRLPDYLGRRAERVRRYGDLLRGVPVSIPDFDLEPDARPAHHIFPVLLPPGTDRAAVMAHMRGRGVQTSIHYPPIHHHSDFATLGRPRLPRTEDAAARELTLPLYPGLMDDQLQLVRDSLAEALELSEGAS